MDKNYKIIAIADIHIPSFKRIYEYEEKLNILYENIKKEIDNDGDKYDETRILILGDLFNNKNQISNECNVVASTFIRKIQAIAKVYVIAGNHDLILENQNRLDSITALFTTAQFDNSFLLDTATNYTSGLIYDGDIIWALFSIYDDYKSIDLSDTRKNNPDKKIIGLFHGTVAGAVLNNGYGSESGLSDDLFDNCDIVLGGHIHKRQILRRKGIDIVYCGSFMQHNYGESVTQHGYLSLSIENGEISYHYVDIPNDANYVKLEISKIEDIDEDKEIMKNI